MASGVRIGGTLPGGDKNGLGAFYKELCENPTDRRVMIAIVDVKKIERTFTDGDEYDSPVVQIRRVEVVTADDMVAAHRLLQRAWEQRSGTPVLPLDLEDDIKAVFAGFDAIASFDERDPETISFGTNVRDDGTSEQGSPDPEVDEFGEPAPDGTPSADDPFADPFGDEPTIEDPPED